MLQFDEEKQKHRLESFRDKEQEDLAGILSEKYGVPYVDLSLISINTDALRIITEENAREANAVAFDVSDRKLKVAVLSPIADKTKDLVKDLEDRGYYPALYMASQNSLNRGWERYKDLSYSSESKGGVLEVSEEEISKWVSEISSVSKIKEKVDSILAVQKGFHVSQIVEVVLAGALATGASDLHFEPEETFVRLRFRLSGVLTEVVELKPETYKMILSRLKLLSNLKLNLKNIAQDGRFSIKMGEVDVEIRTSTVPGAYGESVVMRVLNPEAISVPMEALGMEPEILTVILRELKKPNGMILNTGPTGSGKTTTLYAFLKRIHTPDIKIITIEDPIEYHLPGIVQTQTDRENGYTFAAGLRAALRQDPDIIMVGEIRDDETADIAVNSALTGHLVFSTLHTNTAAGTFPRLVNLGVNPRILSSAMNVAMAQRLVRKLCPFCKKQMTLEDPDKKMIDQIIVRVPVPEKIVQKEFVYIPTGCEKCDNTGYKGRVGIFELILMSDAVDEVVKMNGSEREIREAAREQKIPTMREDAVIKIMRGDTSIEEVMRAIDLTAEDSVLRKEGSDSTI